MSQAGPASLRLTPGRIAALALGVPFALGLIAFGGFDMVSALGQASFPVNHTFTVTDGKVTAQIAGNITLKQAHRSDAWLDGTARYSLFRPAISESGGTVNFDCHFYLGNCSLDGTLEVPENAAVSLSTAGGDVTLGNYTGDLTLHSDGGNLSADELTGSRLSLTTSGGDVNVNTLTVSGTTALNLASDGGNISAQNVTAKAATVTTAGGDVYIRYTRGPQSVTINADGGNVTLVLPHGDYAFNVGSDGGNVSYPSGENDLGAADKINVHTAGGDINVTEAK